MPQQFSKQLLSWFQKHGRTNLPWQKKQTPYRVWISEIMLQQTQVNTVIPYFQKFMQSFPTVKKLALAHEDTVLHHWTGLGYYARARNLHKAAKVIHGNLKGKFPDTVEALCELPGIGKSTAGAIISLASKKRAVILDGNVKRVLSRYHCIQGWPDQAKTQKQLWQIADEYTPEKNCAQYTQAIMDLGATICTRSKPACTLCPIQQSCLAFKQNKVDHFPHKKPKKTLPVKTTRMLILQSADSSRVLLEKRPPQGIWGGLWSFPEIELTAKTDEFLEKQGLGKAREQQHWQKLRHSFSHFHLDISPVVISLNKQQDQIMENHRWHWYDLQKPAELGLATPVKKLLNQLASKL